jgi:replicative DNA helicase
MGSVKSPLDVATSLVASATARRSDPRPVWGIPWGFPGLDYLTGGIHPGEMTVLMARPGVGKTTIMEQVTSSVCAYLASDLGQREHPGAVVRLVLCESSAEQFQQRMTCHLARVSARRVRDGSLSDEGWQRYVEASRTVARLPIEYLDSPLSLEDTTRFLRGQDKPCVWWAVDYLQIHPITPGRPNDGSTQATTLASGHFREVAKTLAPGLMLSQMSREVDKREDRRPTLQDLRGSGAIEQDARVVLGLYREDIYLKIAEEHRATEKPAELLLLKQNEGDSNVTIWMRWHPDRAIFEDVSRFAEGEALYDLRPTA